MNVFAFSWLVPLNPETRRIVRDHRFLDESFELSRGALCVKFGEQPSETADCAFRHGLTS